jgi:hypothetical protein
MQIHLLSALQLGRPPWQCTWSPLCLQVPRVKIQLVCIRSIGCLALIETEDIWQLIHLLQRVIKWGGRKAARLMADMWQLACLHH